VQGEIDAGKRKKGKESRQNKKEYSESPEVAPNANPGKTQKEEGKHY